MMLDVYTSIVGLRKTRDRSHKNADNKALHQHLSSNEILRTQFTFYFFSKRNPVFLNNHLGIQPVSAPFGWTQMIKKKNRNAWLIRSVVPLICIPLVVVLSLSAYGKHMNIVFDGFLLTGWMTARKTRENGVLFFVLTLHSQQTAHVLLRLGLWT